MVQLVRKWLVICITLRISAATILFHCKHKNNNFNVLNNVLNIGIKTFTVAMIKALLYTTDVQLFIFSITRGKFRINCAEGLCKNNGLVTYISKPIKCHQHKSLYNSNS